MMGASKQRLGTAVLAAAVTLACGSGSGEPSTPSTAVINATQLEPSIEQIAFLIANVFIIHGKQTILFDSGSAGTVDALAERLTELGFRRGNLPLVVLSHGHADHAGGAKMLRDRFGSRIVAGRGDRATLARGTNDTLVPTSLFARMLKPFIDNPFPPLKADIEVSTTFDLRPYGIAGEVIAVPGHTPGSLAILLDDGDALVGDLILGGYAGATMFTSSPGTHYYQDDQAAAEGHTCALIARGAKRLYLGHGGPVTAEDVWATFCEEKGPFPHVVNRPRTSPPPRQPPTTATQTPKSSAPDAK